MRVLGLDSAMTNTGWHVLDVGPRINGPVGSHAWFSYVAGGTIKEPDATEFDPIRLWRTTEAVHNCVADFKPDILVIENALQVGMSRSTTGLALLSLILQPYRPLSSPSKSFRPKYVVLITPERLQSIAHEERSTSGTVVVQRYKERAHNPPKHRITQHEADAYFLAYHGTRFIKTAIEETWNLFILSAKEKRVFLEATADVKKRIKGKKGLHPTGEKRSTAMKDLRNQSWWEPAQP